MSKATARKVRTFAGSSLLLALASLVAKILGAVYRIPLTNILGAEGIGLYQLVFPVYSLMLTLSSAALPVAIARLVSESNALGKGEEGKKYLKSALLLLVCASGLGAVVFALLSAPLSRLQGNDMVKYCYLCVAPAILFVGVASYFKGWFQGNMNMIPTATSQIVEQVAKMIFGLTFAYFLRPRGVVYAVSGALVGLTIAEFISLVVVASAYFFHRPRGVLSARMDWSSTLALVKVSTPIMLSSLIFPIVQFADSLLIVNILTAGGMSRALATQQYGILTAPVGSLVNMPVVITLAFAVTIVPIISSKRAVHDAPSIKSKCDFALKLAYLFGVPCFMALAVLAPQLMRLLYPTFDAESTSLAVLLLILSAVNVVLLSVQQVYNSVLQALGKTMLAARNLFVTALVKISLDIVLIYYIGIVGAVVSGVVAYLIGCVLGGCTMSKLLGKNDKIIKNISKISLVSVIIGLIILGFSYLPMADIWVLLVAVVVSVPVYVLLIVAFRVLNSQELSGFPCGKWLVKLNDRLERHWSNKEKK